MNSPGLLWLHRFAVLTAVCTFPLIFAGGLVTSTGSALAVPDWPTTYGQNMFLFPLSQWVGGIFYEHSHRLIGALVGMLTVALTVWIWLCEPRRSVRWLALVAVVAVSVQGLLGGLRVVRLNEHLAIVHACLAQAFFGLMVSLALITSRSWRTNPPSPVTNPRFRAICLISTGLIYLQIILGAFTRHTTWGTAYHVVGALAVAAVAIWVLAETMKTHAGPAAWARPAWLLFALVLIQIFAGFAALLARAGREADLPATTPQMLVPTLHVALGALILATSLVLTLRACRLCSPSSKSSAPPLAAQPSA